METGSVIDVRAGLHETSAASILGLGAFNFLFGVSAAQTIADYRILLRTIRGSLLSWPEAPDIRSQFRMVQGRATSASADQQSYRADCWQLWLETLYDAVGDELDASAFSFDLDDKDGPHYPWVIQNAESYLTFDPQRTPEHLSESMYAPVFNDFLVNLRSLVNQRIVT